MIQNNDRIKNIIISRGCRGREENLRIYEKFFKDRRCEQEYIYKKFQIDFGLKILDIGCGYGHDLIHFSDNSVGLELGKHKVNFARSLGLNVIMGNAENDLAKIEQKFDLIWCLDFLVHTVSPYKFLCDCRKLLPVGGRMVVQIPLMSILNKHRSECHFYAFNKKSLLYLLEMAGFEALKISGLVRKKPTWFNFMFELALQKWGGNLWVLVEKKDKTPVDFKKTYLPAWFSL